MAAAAIVPNSKTLHAKVGSRDEAGFLKGLKRGGFSAEKSMLELIANSLDANSTSIRLIRNHENYKLSDNGNAMSTEGFKKMFCAQLENHSHEKTRGVSGYGSKPALAYLSEYTSVTIISIRDNTKTTAYVPWDKMYSESRYDGMIDIESVPTRITQSGTTIIFPRTTVMDTYFQRLEENEISPYDNPATVFGADKFVFTLKDNTNTIAVSKELKLFDYFGGDRIRDYYFNYDTHLIQVYSHKTTHMIRYILNFCGHQLEIVKCGKGFTRLPVKPTENTMNYDLVGNYEIKVGLRKYKDGFDEEYPSDKNLGSGEIWSKPFESYIPKDSITRAERHRFMVSPHLRRNR